MYYGDRIRILVVDDEPSICDALQRALSRAGYEVVVVYTGEDAERRIMTEHFDVLIADLRMTDTRGDVVYYFAIGKQPHLGKSTFFLTGDISEAAERLIGATGCPVLPKPFDLGEVLAMVSSFCRLARPASA